MLAAVRHSFPWLWRVFADSGFAGKKRKGALAKIGKWTLQIVKRSDKAKGFELLPRRWGVNQSYPVYEDGREAKAHALPDAERPESVMTRRLNLNLYLYHIEIIFFYAASHRSLDGCRRPSKAIFCNRRTHIMKKSKRSLELLSELSSAVRCTTKISTRFLGSICGRNLIRRFRRSESGSYAITTALLMPVLVGSVSFAVDASWWAKSHQTMQGAADSAAASAATAYASNNKSDFSLEAAAISSSYGFVKGLDGVTLTVNRPPASGPNMANPNVIEIIIQQPATRYFSMIFGSQEILISARSAAKANGGLVCVLALNSAASGAVSTQGSSSISLNNCNLVSDSNNASSISVGGSSNISAYAVQTVGGVSGSSAITATQGISTGARAVSDPYASTSFPAYTGCDKNNFTEKNTLTINPGVYCGGMTLNAGANLTMNPGTYYMDQGSLSINGGATLTGIGVTIVFTSSTGSNYATATINGGATVNLSPPTSGPTAGIVLFGDRSMPAGTSFSLLGGGSQVFTGATYLPKAAVGYAGGANSTSSCTKLIGDTITFKGNSNFAINCPGQANKQIGSTSAQLVE